MTWWKKARLDVCFFLPVISMSIAQATCNFTALCSTLLRPFSSYKCTPSKLRSLLLSRLSLSCTVLFFATLLLLCVSSIYWINVYKNNQIKCVSMQPYNQVESRILTLICYCRATNYTMFECSWIDLKPEFAEIHLKTSHHLHPFQPVRNWLGLSTGNISL